MKVISWNLSCFRKQGAFEYALKHLMADIYFFQECQHPLTYLTKAEHRSLLGKYVWDATENGWGNCILSRRAAIEAVDIETSFKGRVLAGRLNTEELLLINLHVPITGNHSRYNLKAIFEEIHSLQKDARAIVAGDLNFGAYFDKNGEADHGNWLRGLLDQNNLVSCFHKFHQEEKQTFRMTRKQTECMLDYIFVTRDLENQIKECDVFKNDSIVAMSDHNALVVEIVL